MARGLPIPHYAMYGQYMPLKSLYTPEKIYHACIGSSNNFKNNLQTKILLLYLILFELLNIVFPLI